MKILCIHGMNQQNYNADTLKEFWLQVLQTGFQRANLDIDVNQLDIVLPFYGDLLTQHHLSNSLNVGTMMPKAWQNFQNPIPKLIANSTQCTTQHAPLQNAQQDNQQSIEQAHSFSTPFGSQTNIVQDKNPCLTALPCNEDIEPKTMTQRLSLATALAKDRALKELIIFLNHYPKLHASLIEKFLIETYLYLDNAEFMHEVHNRIMQHIEPRQDYLIVAHSLGTVIAYNLLQHHKLRHTKRLITLGSPLAFKVIQDRLKPPIHRPRHFHGDWLNFHSLDDFLTTFPLSQTPFDFQPPIQNFAIHTQINNPHRIIGYLAHPRVIQRITESIGAKFD